MKAHLVLILIGLAWFGAYTYADSKEFSQLDACVYNTLNSIEKLANQTGNGDYVTTDADVKLAKNICADQVKLNNCVESVEKEIEKQKNMASGGDYIATGADRSLAVKVCTEEINSK